MTNEQLAVAAKGDRAAARALWERTYRLIYKLTARYFPLCASCGVEPDDLRQAGYFALLRAVDAYDPDRGFLFTSYIGLHVANVALETLGLRGCKRRPQGVASLDGPISDGLTLADCVADPDALLPLERAEDAIFTAQLRDALLRAA